MEDGASAWLPVSICKPSEVQGLTLPRSNLVPFGQGVLYMSEHEPSPSCAVYEDYDHIY